MATKGATRAPATKPAAKGRQKAPKDPNAPKKNLSAYFHFCASQRASIKKDNPDLSLGDTAKELGRRWANLDQTAKKPFEQAAQKDKERYNREMQSYGNGGPAKGKGKAAARPRDEDSDDGESD